MGVEKAIRFLRINLRKNRGAFLVSAAFVYLFNYQICEYFYKDDITKWWFLKSDLYSVCICLLFITISTYARGVLGILMSLITGWSISDCVDRIFLHTRDFTSIDLVMIILTTIYAGYEFIQTSNR